MMACGAACDLWSTAPLKIFIEQEDTGRVFGIQVCAHFIHSKFISQTCRLEHMQDASNLHEHFCYGSSTNRLVLFYVHESIQ